MTVTQEETAEMDKVDWKSKLSSRKFWAAIVAFATALLGAFGLKDPTIEQVAMIITAAGSLIAFILGEGWVDASRVKANTSHVEVYDADIIDAQNEVQRLEEENDSLRRMYVADIGVMPGDDVGLTD